jgi:hypothetical protein
MAVGTVFVGRGGGWSDGRRETALHIDMAIRKQITPQRASFCCGGGANRVDFGTQDWYTRLPRAHEKCLILLGFCDRSGNPSRSAGRPEKTNGINS